MKKPTSTTGSKSRTFRRREFTLLEIVAVIVIAAAIGVAGVAMRKTSPGATLERGMREFRIFCAKVRARTVADGTARAVVFYPEERCFRGEAVRARFGVGEWESRDFDDIVHVLEIRDADGKNPVARARETAAESRGAPLPPMTETALQWQLPPDFELASDDAREENFSDGDTMELFRFTPDGGAAGLGAFTMRYHTLAQTAFISPLTGKLTVRDGEAADRTEPLTMGTLNDAEE